MLLILLIILGVGAGVGLTLSHSTPRARTPSNPTSHTGQSSTPQTTGKNTTGKQVTDRPIIGMGRSGTGFVAHQITAIGDSVMVDYQDVLKQYLPGVNVDATVGLQFATGINQLTQLRNEDRLGATVIVALGTNGPITPTLMAQMLAVLHGASRIVFVTNHRRSPVAGPQ